MSGVKKLPNLYPANNCTTSAFEPSYRNRYNHIIESSNAEVGQVIPDMNFTSFLRPDMTSKYDARHDTD